MIDHSKCAANKQKTKKSDVSFKSENRVRTDPLDSRHDTALFLQRMIGNQAVVRLLQFGALQAKLTISRPDDIYEQEADRVAGEVMRMSEPQVQRQPLEEEEEKVQTQPIATTITPLVQRQAPEEEEEAPLQAKDASGQSRDVNGEFEGRIYRLQAKGERLPDSVREYMESRFGVDFSNVRLHTGAGAAELACALNAHAFTVGRDILFGAGQYAPETELGKHLLAHELTHVVQQSGDIQNHSTHRQSSERPKQDTSATVKGDAQRKPLVVSNKEDRMLLPRKKGEKRAELTSAKTDLTKEDIANIVNIHLIDYREQVKTGIDNWSPPEESNSTAWFLVALGGNLVWAATCLVNPMASAVIIAMSFGGAAVGSGTLEKLFAGEKVPKDVLKPLLTTQVSAYVDRLKNNLTNLVDRSFAYFRLRHKMLSTAGWLDAGKKLQERREVVWNSIFDGKVAPWGDSTAIITNTTKEVEAIWKQFKSLYEFRIMNIYGTALRYEGEKLREEVLKIYYESLVKSGVAERSPAVKVSKVWEGFTEFKAYEFPPPAPEMTGATVRVPTGRRAIPVELVK
jgi:hypothetical protein